jgi:hypothetical protein
MRAQEISLAAGTRLNCARAGHEPAQAFSTRGRRFRWGAVSLDNHAALASPVMQRLTHRFNQRSLGTQGDRCVWGEVVFGNRTDLVTRVLQRLALPFDQRYLRCRLFAVRVEISR